jgi:hypothetical protein
MSATSAPTGSGLDHPTTGGMRASSGESTLVSAGSPRPPAWRLGPSRPRPGIPIFKEFMTMTKLFSSAPRRMTIVVLLAGTLAVAGCGGSTKTVSSTGANGQVTTQTVPNVHFAKTKFVLHAGLAFGAIHRYIYKPLRAGALHKGAPGRAKVLLKGAAAAVFAVHELRLAHDDALSSDLLRPLTNKVDGLSSKLAGLVSGLKNGSVNPAAIASASGATDALGSASSGLGVRTKDISSALR